MNGHVVVTGASGHIGFHVARTLCAQNHYVLLLVRSVNANVAALQRLGASIAIVDLTVPDSYRAHLHGASALFHLASENTTDTSDEARVLRNTAGLTKTVLATAVEEKIPTIIYTSSVVVLGRSSDPHQLIDESGKNLAPESPYVRGKIDAEQFCESLIAQGHDIRRVYPSWVVGSHNAVLTPPHGIIHDFLKRGQPFVFDGGISIADVEQVALAHVAAWTKGSPRSQYVLGGANITFNDLYTHLAALSRGRSPLVTLPKWFILAGAQVATALLGKKSPVSPEYVRSIIGNYSWYDSSKAVRELGYAIPPVDETLKKGIDEVRFHLSGLHHIAPKKNADIQRTAFAPQDRLLITGFPGWLANRMVDILINGDRNGRFAVDRPIRLLVLPSFKGMRFGLPENLEIVYGDLKDKHSLRDALRGVSAVYHCAGAIYPPKIDTLYDVNWRGTKNLVDACIESGVRRIVSMGTDSICGYGREKRFFDENTPARPYKNYGKSKYLAERYILEKTKDGFIDGTSLRGFWFFGPYMPDRNQSLVTMMTWPRQLIFGDGKNVRSLTHIDNVVQAFVKCEKEPKSFGKWYWITDKKFDTTIDEIFRTMGEKMGRPYKPLYIPPVLCEFFSLADIAISWTGYLQSTIHAAGKFHKDIAGDHRPAQRDFGYEPMDTFEHFTNDISHFYRVNG